MKRYHLHHCRIGLTVGLGLVVIIAPGPSSLAYLAAVLICPLMIVLMLRAMLAGDGHGQHHPPVERETTPPDRSVEAM